jgi:hypothetical protein
LNGARPVLIEGKAGRERAHSSSPYITTVRARIKFIIRIVLRLGTLLNSELLDMKKLLYRPRRKKVYLKLQIRGHYSG